MKSPDNVLLGLALILFAGVILYNVLFVDVEVVSHGDDTTITSTETVTTSVESSTAVTVKVDSKININTATAEELETLSGIGPTKAQAIVSYRETNGNFSTVDDLINVSGIGEKTLAKIIDDITV